MQSRASVINLNWGKAALTSGSVGDRCETPSAIGRQTSSRDVQVSAAPGVSRHPDTRSDLESVSATVETYNEAAFRYFLKVEEKRFLRSNKRFLLLLVDVHDESGNLEDFDPLVGRKLLAALWPCVRETDFVGWYRQGSVIGVACTQVDDTQGAAMATMVAERYQKAMREALSEEAGNRLQVRSYFFPSNSAERS